MGPLPSADNPWWNDYYKAKNEQAAAADAAANPMRTPDNALKKFEQDESSGGLGQDNRRVGYQVVQGGDGKPAIQTVTTNPDGTTTTQTHEGIKPGTTIVPSGQGGVGTEAPKPKPQANLDPSERTLSEMDAAWRLIRGARQGYGGTFFSLARQQAGPSSPGPASHPSLKGIGFYDPFGTPTAWRPMRPPRAR